MTTMFFKKFHPQKVVHLEREGHVESKLHINICSQKHYQ